MKVMRGRGGPLGALPQFWNVADFAELFNISAGHVRHGCRNFIDGPIESNPRAKLIDGYGAFRWSNIYVVYDLSDEFEIEHMFNVKLGSHRR